MEAETTCPCCERSRARRWVKPGRVVELILIVALSLFNVPYDAREEATA